MAKKEKFEMEDMLKMISGDKQLTKPTKTEKEEKPSSLESGHKTDTTNVKRRATSDVENHGKQKVEKKFTTVLIRKNLLKYLKIIYPDLPIQDAVAEILVDWNRRNKKKIQQAIISDFED